MRRWKLYRIGRLSVGIQIYRPTRRPSARSTGWYEYKLSWRIRP